MRPIDQLLSHLRALDIKLWMEGEHLHYDAPPGTLKQELREELIERKSEVAAALRRMNAEETRIAPQKREGNIPLSFAQERLWFLEQLEPGNPIYNLPSILRLTGAIDKPALAKSLAEIIRRHESLRTVFRAADGKPVQVVLPQIEFALREVDLIETDESNSQHQLQQVIDGETRWRFNLEKGPFIRATLVRLSEQEHVFLLNIHHSVSDGWSLEILNRELSVIYAAFIRGEPSPLPELPVQYADFAIWQRQWLKGKVLEDQLSYWKRQLGGELTVLDLPSDRTRAPLQTHLGEKLEKDLPDSLCASLRRLSGQQGASLFMVLLAAFKVLLHRHTGKTDLIIGTPIAGRTRSETEGLIGFFLNTLVLRTNLAGASDFREVLHRVRETTLGAYAHQDVPFEKLLEELHIKRDLSRTPMFQVFFNMLNFSSQEMRLSGLTVEPVPFSGTGSKFDLTLYVIEHDKHIHLDLVYNTDLFAEARMAALLDQFGYLLEQVIENPEKGIDAYSLLTPKSRKALPDPHQTLNRDWIGSVHELFSKQAFKKPQKIALQDKTEIWTYGELDQRSSQLAHYLRDRDAGYGKIVAIYAHRSASLVWSVLGVLKSGAAFLILDPSYPENRLLDYLHQARPAGCLHIAAAGILPEKLKKHLDQNSCVHLLVPTRREAERTHFLEEYASTDPAVTIGPDDPALIAFTSGSSGMPKGILGRHGPLSHFLPWQQETFHLGSEDRYSMLSGIAHDPLQRDIFTSLCLGAMLCIPDPEKMREPGWLARWMREQEISITHLTPALLNLLTQTGDSTQHRPVLSLRYAFTVGDVLTKKDVLRLRQLAPKVRSVNFYGTTETQRAVGYYEVPEELGKISTEAIPLGRGIKDVQLLVLTPSDHLAGISEPGEICVRSPHLAKKYLNDDELTRKRFIINPLTNVPGDLIYRTGDAGRYLPDGNVIFSERMDQQVKIRGFRIELGEIEARLRQHEDVKETVVLVRENQVGEKQLVSYLVWEAGRDPDASVLRTFLKKRLPEYMIPSIFVVLKSLPVTPNGKLDRKALPAPPKQETRIGKNRIAPQSPLERGLADIWCKVLGIEQVGIRDDFFELGGHSLLATQAIAQIRQVFKIEVPVRTFFESPTIAELAEKIAIINWAAGNLQDGIQETEMHNREEIRL